MALAEEAGRPVDSQVVHRSAKRVGDDGGVEPAAGERSRFLQYANMSPIITKERRWRDCQHTRSLLRAGEWKVQASAARLLVNLHL